MPCDTRGEQPAIFEVAVKKSLQSKGSPPKISNWFAWNSNAVPVTFGDLEGTPDDAAGALNNEDDSAAVTVAGRGDALFKPFFLR